jgi:hypothetical protein
VKSEKKNSDQTIKNNTLIYVSNLEQVLGKNENVRESIMPIVNGRVATLIRLYIKCIRDNDFRTKIKENKIKLDYPLQITKA